LAIDAPTRDDAEYAERFGVDIAEAQRRLSQQGAIADFRLELEREEPETFGGAYIDHVPEYRVVVQFTGDTQAPLSRHPAPASIAGDIAVERVDFTLAELYRDLDTLYARLGEGPLSL